MSEYLEGAVEELKRADHMIYVSLKYTRTVDVIRNIVERLIACFEFVFDYLLEHLRETKQISEIPAAKAKKIEVLKEHFKDNTDFQEYVEFYLMMRKILKAEFTRRQEFRRHVTMTAVLDDKRIVELNIDVMHDYYAKAKAFVDFSVHLITPEKQ